MAYANDFHVTFHKVQSAMSFFQGIDWPILEKQKLRLLEMREEVSHRTYPEKKSDYDALSGIIHLLDSLQDLVNRNLIMLQK